MDTTEHSLSTLFEQLGLPSDSQSIDEFVERHRPLTATTPLPEAPWWNEAQSHFLSEALEADADWSELVDELDALLRE